MRDRTFWRSSLLPHLRKAWPASLTEVGPGFLLDIELGLYLLARLVPAEPAQSLWTLLAGYPLLHGSLREWNEDQRRQIGIGRHLLLHFKSRYEWCRALEQYAGLPEQLRGYEIFLPNGRYESREVVVASRRWERYEAALCQAPRYRKERVAPAGAGPYLISAGQQQTSVTIPGDLPFPGAPRGHDLIGRPHREPLTVAWADLLETASWMDRIDVSRGTDPSWHQRLSRVQLGFYESSQGAFLPTEAITIDRLLHLAGMVSSGKSTLMDVLAVWAARQGMQVTLVVGDVMNALRRVEQFRLFGIPAAPILGTSNRKRHIERLHRALVAEGASSPLAHHHPGFDYLSTACALDGLRSAPMPLDFDDAPCRTLMRLDGDTDDNDHAETRKFYGCPFWASCQRHTSARDLVGAAIWVATPASLIYTQVPTELNGERLRYAELVYRRSDLLIVDEADQVQVQLDIMFSPGQTLIGQGRDSWLDVVLQWKDQELAQGGRRQFAESSVSIWSVAGDAARTATNRLYGLLQLAPPLQKWLEDDYFTEWTLSDQLARAWCGARGDDAHESPIYRRLRDGFDTYLGDPLGDRGEALQNDFARGLAELSRQALPSSNEATLRRQIRDWLGGQQDLAIADEETDEAVVRLECTMLVAVLSDRLNVLIQNWKQVEAPLNLEGSSPLLFHRPPEDFLPVVPESPMGNVLGFQYRRNWGASEQMGELRFFRCAGLGRWVLLHFHELFLADGVAGPNTLLLSGTSWAGTSPHYHIQLPVGGILMAPSEEVEAIARSAFAFAPQYDANGQPIRISGLRADARFAALAEMLAQLVRRGRMPGAPSKLEQERKRLPNGRQRILLLVGSYEETKYAYEAIIRQRPDWRGQVRRLVSDDYDFQSGWDDEATGLRRGEVDRFAGTGAWLLIAPLMAIERGHNILNENDQAAIGAAYFLVRPHPRPDDINFAIHAINHWAIAQGQTTPHHGRSDTLDELGRAFRNSAYRQWRHLLRLPMVYRTLPAEERTALTWTQLVGMWQVIGRLVRGGSEAKVYFCDAAFAPQSAGGNDEDTAASSILVSMFRILRPYFDSAAAINGEARAERQLVQVLYGPLYAALTQIQGVADATAVQRSSP